MKTVKEVSNLTGVSVRTLHYYDKIGLLKPAVTKENGYRLYDDTNIKRLSNILLFRELKFSLEEIKNILDSKAFDSNEAVAQQIKLLTMEKEHIEGLISLACKIKEKGVCTMDFNKLDKTEINNYKDEVIARWGDTKKYKEFTEKNKDKSEIELDEKSKALMQIFESLGKLKGLSPDEKTVQEKIEELQKFICENYYQCEKNMLLSLGQMYTGDERMKKNIDKAGGDGTAEFAKKAIEYFCK